MTRFEASRRRFLSSLGLGLGATVLSPLASRLYGEAWGQPAPARKNVVFISLSGGLPDLQLGWPSRTDEQTWALHEALAPLAPWRQRMLVVRNLSLGLAAMQHSGGHGLLSCLGSGDGETAGGNVPAGITIDQAIAAHTSADLPLRSLLFGVDRDPAKVMHRSLFAAGEGQPVPYPVRAAKLYESLFPSAAGNQARAAADRRVLARLRADVTRLQRRLAGPERARLDTYLESLEAFDRRRSGAQCLAPDAPPEARGAVVELPAMLDMAAVALRCGLTRVVGAAVGGGNSHFHFPLLVGPHVGTAFEALGHVDHHGHDSDDTYSAARTVAFRWLAGEVATFLTALSQPGPTGRSVLDDTVVVLFSDSGPGHHNLSSGAWRFLLIGDAGGALRADGRFLTYTPDVPWEPVKPGMRSVNSLWCTLAQAVGAPLEAFGVGGSARTNGALPELLA